MSKVVTASASILKTSSNNYSNIPTDQQRHVRVTGDSRYSHDVISGKGYRLGGLEHTMPTSKKEDKTSTRRSSCSHSKTKVENGGAREKGSTTSASGGAAGRRNFGNINDDRMASTSTSTESLPATLEQYYETNGINYKRLRKNSKVQYMIEGVTFTVDMFTAPKGYSGPEKDLHEPDMGERISQGTEQQSPAVELAGQAKRIRPKVMSTPEVSSEEIVKLFQRHTKNEAKNELRETEKVSNQLANLSHNGSFPEDSFNNSELIFASQQVEEQYAADFKSHSCKPDINGNQKAAMHQSNDSPQFAPVTSTPINYSTHTTNRNKNLFEQGETPKARGGLARKRNISSNTSIFERSTIEIELSPIKSVDEQDTRSESGTPRKVLKFDHIATKSMINENIFGDFEDDEDDHLFSQVPMPKDMNPPPATVLKNSSKLGGLDKTEPDVTDCEGLNDSEIAILDKLEDLHCRSSSSNSTNSSFQDNNGRVKRIGIERKKTKGSSKQTEACSTPLSQMQTPRRIGLSRKRK